MPKLGYLHHTDRVEIVLVFSDERYVVIEEYRIEEPLLEITESYDYGGCTVVVVSRVSNGRYITVFGGIYRGGGRIATFNVGENPKEIIDDEDELEKHTLETEAVVPNNSDSIEIFDLNDHPKF